METRFIAIEHAQLNYFKLLKGKLTGHIYSFSVAK